MENFDFDKLKNLNFAQQKEYITKYFIPLNNGSHCLFVNGSYELMTDEVIKKVYFKRFDKKLTTFYFEEFTDLKSPVYEINKPQFYDDKINLCPPLPKYKPFKDFSEETRQKAKIFLDYTEEILCNYNKEVLAHLNKWVSNICKGKKNDCALVLKTLLKGAGKSTFPTFIRDHMIGNKLSLETGSEPIKSKFNAILGGKLFVMFEELETFTQSEWVAVDSILKRQITSKLINLQKKGQEAFEANNLNNYVLLSNHDLSDDDRRYFVLDVQTHRKGDRKYWSNLYDNCFNDEVGNCLYSYYYETDTTNFQPQDYPLTKNKLNSISKRLDSVFLFLKEEFILKNKSIDGIKLKDFYEMYECFCLERKKRICDKTTFTSKLSEVQINYKLSNGYNRYKISLEALKVLSKTHNWINELDEFEKKDDDKTIIEDETNLKILTLENKIKELEAQLLKFQQNEIRKEENITNDNDIIELEKELNNIISSKPIINEFNDDDLEDILEFVEKPKKSKKSKK